MNQGSIFPIRIIVPEIIELLLLADPDIDHINSYLDQCKIWSYGQEDLHKGIIAVVSATRSAEIVNLAVRPDCLRRGIGKQLLAYALKELSLSGIEKVTVKTGNSSLPAIALYEKTGFKLVETIPNYFVHNYPQPIYENGLLCKDQLIYEILL